MSETDAALGSDEPPRPPGVVRRFLGRHELAVDLGIAMISLAIQYFVSLDRDGLGLAGDLTLHGTWPILLVGCAAVVLRRRRTTVATIVVAVAGGALLLFDRPYLMVPAVVTVYAAAVYRSARTAWTVLGVLVGVYLVAFLVGQVAIHGYALESSVNGVIGVGLVLSVGALIGVNVGNRTRYLDALIERAAQLERERDQQGQLAAAAERARIAREMHDVVAHSLSVVVRLSDGADAIAQLDPAKSREAVRQIGTVGRESLRDMRRLLGVLRDGDEAALAPQPTLDELDRLIETYRSAGLPVAVQRTGEPPEDGALQVAVFRTVQEGLTNALRYATEPSRVLVRLAFGPAETTVTISDDGIFVGPKPSVGTGRGLVGLRERAAVFGGSVEAGPGRPDGAGWRIYARLPHHREDTR